MFWVHMWSHKTFYMRLCRVMSTKPLGWIGWVKIAIDWHHLSTHATNKVFVISIFLMFGDKQRLKQMIAFVLWKIFKMFTHEESQGPLCTCRWYNMENWTIKKSFCMKWHCMKTFSEFREILCSRLESQLTVSGALLLVGQRGNK